MQATKILHQRKKQAPIRLPSTVSQQNRLTQKQKRLGLHHLVVHIFTKFLL